MEHKMKLKTPYYYYILNGTKRIEIRLNDEKRQKIKIGDTIKFTKYPELDDSFKVRVIDLLKYDSLEELMNDYNIEFYTKEEQAKYGVLGIKIELI